MLTEKLFRRSFEQIFIREGHRFRDRTKYFKIKEIVCEHWCHL